MSRPPMTPDPESTYVVGAGTSGAVIAARATERAARHVVLLEAGPDYPTRASVPADLRDGTRNALRSHDWGYRYRPTPGALLLPQPRGRVVGGSSAVNTCIALRGQPADYDEWAALGLPEWSWAHCLPAFKRLENDLDVRNEWHGQDGPMPIRRFAPEELCAWQSAFLGASEELGHPACPDSNDPTGTGHGPHAMNLLHGERVSAARAYLTPEVRARENLSIRPNVTVRRVIVVNRRVEGLEVEARGEVRVLPTRRVVLCAGAVATPGILLRSGIGPRRELERLGVPLVSDVPALGKRMLDHPGVVMVMVPRSGACSVHDPMIQTCLRYTSEGSPTENDVLLQPGSFLQLPDGVSPLFTLMACIEKPRGHAELRFPSADPHARPHMIGHVLSDPYDRRRAVEGLEVALRLASSRAMRGLADFAWPIKSVLSDPEALSAWVGRSSGTAFHMCGTVPMGPEGSLDAAVDGRGRVRGVTGLFVADASVFPTIPSANTNLPTLMVGERFGEWLRTGAMD
ncbi:MAG: GMC family oxidoreductase N-terminal domain-containing protein [Sandaracinus sp.]